MSTTALLRRPPERRPAIPDPAISPLRGGDRETVRAALRGRADDMVLTASSRADAVAAAVRAGGEHGRVVHCAADALGSVDHLTSELRAGGVAAVVVTGASDVAALVALTNHVHRHGARVVVDATEIVARQPFSIVSHGIDYVVCDGAALPEPSSGAVVIGRADWLNQSADLARARR